MKQYNKPRKSCALFGLGFMEMIPSPRLGFLRGVFLANHLAGNDNLARTTKRQNTQQRKLTIHKKGPNKPQYNNTAYDRQIEPGLVALYNIRPGNGVGLFLQPRNPHGATLRRVHVVILSASARSV